MNDDPCGAGPSRWRARRGCACADGNHEPAPGAGCSAGRSACPWPRLYLLVVWRSLSGVHACGVPGRTRLPLVSSGLARNRRGPETRSQPYRQRSGDCSRVLTSLRLVKPPCRAVYHRRIPSGSSKTRALPSQPSPSARASLYQRDQNVAERLAPAPKTVSFCQSRFSTRRHANHQAGAQAGGQSRRHRIARINCRPETLRRYAARRGRLSCPHLWITMWTDLSSSRFVSWNLPDFRTRGICR